MFLDEVGQVDPVHELHRDEIPAVDLARVKHGDNVRVLERQGCRDLPLIAPPDRRIGEQNGTDDFEGDRSIVGPVRARYTLPIPPSPILSMRM